jgi:hypothetical protein
MLPLNKLTRDAGILNSALTITYVEPLHGHRVSAANCKTVTVPFFSTNCSVVVPSKFF